MMGSIWLVYKRLESAFSLGGYIYLFLAGTTVGAAFVAWASMTWDWYWQTFNLAGVAVAFLCAWLVLALGIFLISWSARARQTSGEVRPISGRKKGATSPLTLEIDNSDDTLWGQTKWFKFSVRNNGDQDRTCQTYLARLTKNGDSTLLLKGERMYLYTSGLDNSSNRSQPVLIKANGGFRKFDLVNATGGCDKMSISSAEFVHMHDQLKLFNALDPQTYLFTVAITCTDGGPDVLTDITLRYEGGNHIVILESRPH